MTIFIENMFAEQLKCNGFALYYYDKIKVGEIDFIVEQNADLLPVEIKSRKDYRSHKALNNLLAIKEFAIKEAKVFCTGNIEVEDNITYYPFYMIMFFQKQEMASKIKFEKIII